MPTCDLCGIEFAPEALTETTDGNHVCAECLDSQYGRCDDCGAFTPASNYYYDGHRIICLPCYEDHCLTCEDCGAIVDVDDAITANSDFRDETQLCENCAASPRYFRCDDCGETFGNRHLRVHDAAHNYCPVCSASYLRCESCGRLVHKDEAEHDEDSHAYYCHDCWNHRHRRGELHGYGYKPTPIFQRRKNDLETALTMGVELEIDKGDDRSGCVSDLCAITDAIYCKTDGSLDNGIEIVTHPCTLAYHTYELRWKALCQAGLKHGFRSHDAETCGLHVHVGRAQLGPNSVIRNYTIAKVLLLVDRHWEKLVWFSRRTARGLDRWAARPEIGDVAFNATEDALTQKALSNRLRGRYQAVNLENDNTIEFRFFRGTLRRDTLIASLQLVSNICEYAMSHSVDDVWRNSTWEDLTGYKHYEELGEYLTNRETGR